MTRSDHRGGGGAEGWREEGKKPRLTPRWLQDVQEGNRLEFEREMERRRQGFARELQRFWRARRAAS